MIAFMIAFKLKIVFKKNLSLVVSVVFECRVVPVEEGIETLK